MKAIRIRPENGEKLSIASISGFSASIGQGQLPMPAIGWEQDGVRYWAALHDLKPRDLDRILAVYRVCDTDAHGVA